MKEQREKIAHEHEDMLTSMQDEIVDMAVGISEQILKREVSESDNEKIVREYFAAKNG